MKCLHVFTLNKVRHNGNIVKMISELEADGEINDTKNDFLVFDQSIYNEFADKCNCIYSKEKKAKAINSRTEGYDIIFLHCLNLSAFEVLKLKKSAIKKMIWVIWGHDLYLNNDENEFIDRVKLVLRKIKWFIPDIRLRSLYAIGISWLYDSLEVRKRFPNVRLVRLGYGYYDLRSTIDECLDNSEKTADTPTKIMIGHSAYKKLHHIPIMKKLEKFKDENIIISLVLSYGNKEYRDKVIKYADGVWGEKAEIITDYLSVPDYIKYINSVDIGIFDIKAQSALGNINYLASLNKKIFLNRNGILKLAFDLEEVETYCVDEIENKSFEEFIRPTEDLRGHQNYSNQRIGLHNKHRWEFVLKELKREFK